MLLCTLALLAPLCLAEAEPSGSVPVYWINMDSAEGSRVHMRHQLSGASHVRIGATTAADIRRLQHAGHSIPALGKGCIDGACETHLAEAAAGFSHLRAIAAAYEAGHGMALVLEDNIDFADQHWTSVQNDLRLLIAHAPNGWELLQLMCNNPVRLKQMAAVRELFAPWTAASRSTGAYVINRAGMERLLARHRRASPGPPREPLFALPEIDLGTDHLLFSNAWTFTATHPLFGVVGGGGPAGHGGLVGGSANPGIVEAEDSRAGV